MLIRCPECNREVSEKASVCMHCGFPMKPVSNMDKLPVRKDDDINPAIKKRTILG